MKPKYKVGQIVWFVDGGEPKECEITKYCPIDFFKHKAYAIKVNGHKRLSVIEESKFAKTKKELCEKEIKELKKEADNAERLLAWAKKEQSKWEQYLKEAK